MFTIFGKSFAQDNLHFLDKKWLVYNVETTKDKGWHASIDNYIIDLTKNDTLVIKYLGDNSLQQVSYHLDEKNGIILSSNSGEVLYEIKELSDSRMILLDEKHKERIYLYPVEVSRILVTESLKDRFLNKVWMNDEGKLQFKEAPYLLYDKVETDYMELIESDGQETIKGGWLIDNMEDSYFLELFSSKSNFKAVYQIRKIDDKQLEAIGMNKKGKILFLRLNCGS